jgi:hypothetical protein
VVVMHVPLFETHKDWITEEEHGMLQALVLYAPRWRFGQVSDDTIQPNYPMWFQNFWNIGTFEFKPDQEIVTNLLSQLKDRFLKLCPSNYKLVRFMASSNTFGIDGDIHTDWPHPDVSITGVLYTDKVWEQNWGGETALYKDGIVEASEYEPRKLITFDSSIAHIGKGPQRRCKEMRTILAFQAVSEDALNARMNKKVDSEL